MSEGVDLTLNAARRAGRLGDFCRRHPSVGEAESFGRLLAAMAGGGPPESAPAASAAPPGDAGDLTGLLHRALAESAAFEAAAWALWADPEAGFAPEDPLAGAPPPEDAPEDAPDDGPGAPAPWAASDPPAPSEAVPEVNLTDPLSAEPADLPFPELPDPTAGGAAF